MKQFIHVFFVAYGSFNPIKQLIMKNNNFLPLILTLLLFTGFLSFGQWDETDKIVASDRQPGDQFSNYNAVSIYGDYAVAGSSLADHSGLSNAGAAYIYKRDNNCNWIQVQKITANIPAADDNFGFAVAIFENLIVVSSKSDDVDENCFRRS